jgi:hypothetical protein
LRLFCLKIFFGSTETVFAHVFPVSNKNEKERRTLVPSTREIEAESGVLARILKKINRGEGKNV